MTFDHPIFTESIQRIHSILGPTGLPCLEQEVLERLIHSSGDFGLAPLIRFTPGACLSASAALADGAAILTDTAMAAAAVSPMASRTFQNPVHNVLQWSPSTVSEGQTRSGLGMKSAIAIHPGSIILIGSSPTALETILDHCMQGHSSPVLVIGMPVGFVGVAESKRRLASSHIPQIRIEGSRGGAGLAAASVNALLRWTFLDKARYKLV